MEKVSNRIIREEYIAEQMAWKERLERTPFKIAMQGKGHLYNISREILSKRGIELEKRGEKERRQTDISLNNQFGVYYISSNGVTQAVSKGYVDMGIAGFNQVIESKITQGIKCIGAMDDDLWKWKIVVATAKKSIKGLHQISTVATQYPEIARWFFEEKCGRSDVEIEETFGGTEAYALMGNIFDSVVELKASGESLFTNGLSVIEEICDDFPVIVLNTESYYANQSFFDSLLNIKEQSLELAEERQGMV